MKLMGLEHNKAKFETIKSELCDFCVAELPSDMSKSVMNEYGVNLLLWEGLGSFRWKYRVEMRAIGKMLDDFHKTRDFLLDWVAACNRCDLVADRIRLHPDRDFLKVDQEFLRLINGEEDEAKDTEPTTTSPVKERKSPSPPAPPVIVKLAPTAQPSVQIEESRLDSPPRTEVKNDHKRSISQVDLTSNESDSPTPKMTKLVTPPGPSPLPQTPVQTATLESPDWNTVILRFNPMDIDTNHVRVPLRRFLPKTQQPAEDTSPYEVDFKDLDQYLHRTVIALTSKIENVYVRLAGDTATPELWSEGELSVIFMLWESLKAVYDRREEIAVELWTSLDSFAKRDG